jgi:hypothetical protein
MAGIAILVVLETAVTSCFSVCTSKIVQRIIVTLLSIGLLLYSVKVIFKRDLL